MNGNDTKLLNEITLNYNWASDAIDTALQDDHDRQAREAQRRGGSVTFRNDRIMAADLQERAMQSVDIARDDALKAVDKALDEARNAITDAPTDDEARYIVAVAGRDDMTRDEIAAALSRYKGHAAQHAIRAAAKRSGLKGIGITTEAERRLDALNAIRNAVEKDFAYYSILGSDHAKRGVIKVNYEFLLENGGDEPSVAKWGKLVFGDPCAPTEQ